MTPTELDKSFTLMLSELLADTGFTKKRKGRLNRKASECEQAFTFYFIRDRGLPGNTYSLTATMSFSFPEADRLTSLFMGVEYDAEWGTGARPFYTVIPDKLVLKFKYCADESLSRFAEGISDDFHSYALPFYNEYDTLKKLEAYFDQCVNDKSEENGFDVIRSNKDGNGRWCCNAAVLCILGKWDKLQRLLEEKDLLIPEQKARIREFISQSKEINI